MKTAMTINMKQVDLEHKKVDSPYSESCKNIVIIDDDLRTRILFRKVFSKAGYDAIAFSDNGQAIQYLKDGKSPIDLLLLDLDMPHIDGRYFCEIVKLKHPDAKIIIASNYSSDIQKFLIYDADDYYDKSEGIQELRQKVKKVFSTISE